MPGFRPSRFACLSLPSHGSARLRRAREGRRCRIPPGRHRSVLARSVLAPAEPPRCIFPPEITTFHPLKSLPRAGPPPLAPACE